MQPIAIEILAVLLEMGARFASSEHLIRRVWGEGDERLQDPVANLRTRIAMLRRAIEPLGFTVDVQYGQGWRLVPFSEATHGNVKRSAANARAATK